MLGKSDFLQSRTFYFNDANFIKFEKKVASINKKIEKQDPSAPIIAYHSEKRVVPLCDIYDNEFLRKAQEIEFMEVNCVNFHDAFVQYYIGGKTHILGVIDHKNDIVYGESDLLEQFRYRTECDHCHRKIHRNKTLIVQTTKEGESLPVVLQVGGSCIKEYTGIDLAILAAVLDIANGASLNEREYNEKGEYSMWRNVEEVAARTVLCVERHGFISKKQGSGSATANVVEDSFYKNCIEKLEPNEENYAKANEILNALREKEPATPFDRNVHAIVARDDGMVSVRAIPFLCAAVGMSFNGAGDAKYVNEYIGSVGECIDLDCIVKNSKVINSAFGRQTVYELADSKGRKVCWFTSRDGYEIGSRLSLRNAVVKKLSMFKGMRSTVVGGKKMKVDKA